MLRTKTNMLKPLRFTRLSIRLLLLAFMLAPDLYAEEALIAVAANFTAPAKDIAAAFEAETAHKAVISFGSTGKLYAQIANGAPFDVFLAADAQRPQKAMQEGLAVGGSGFTYAKGKIVLYSVDPELIDADGAVLGLPETFNKIALPNPKTAPYGEAAIAVMQQLQVYDQLQHKIVQGENISQTYQFIITRNAQLGFIALSQVISNDTGSRWIVPEDLYPPIRQDAVLLSGGKSNKAAEAFLKFLKEGPQARKIIESYGYSLD